MHNIQHVLILKLNDEATLTLDAVVIQTTLDSCFDINSSLKWLFGAFELREQHLKVFIMSHSPTHIHVHTPKEAADIFFFL